MEADENIIRDLLNNLSDDELIETFKQHDLNTNIERYFELCEEELKKRQINISEYKITAKKEDKQHVSEEFINSLERLSEDELILLYRLHSLDIINRDIFIVCENELKKRNIDASILIEPVSKDQGISGKEKEENKIENENKNIYCERCGKEIEADAGFCKECRLAIEEAGQLKQGLIICPHCGYDKNNSEDVFCSKCGKPLKELQEKEKENKCKECGKEITEEGDYCNHCGIKLSKKEIICAKCGKISVEEVNFCQYCGDELKRE